MDSKHKNLKTLSDRLSYAMEQKEINQATLAKRIGVKAQAINYLCKGNTRKSQITYKIAEALSINGAWLASGEGYMDLNEDPMHRLVSLHQRIPLLNHHQIKHFRKHHEFPEFSETQRWLLTDAALGEFGFAIEIVDKSMYPRFDQSTIVIINPEKEAHDHEFVLAYLKEVDDVVLRQLEMANEHQISLNPFNTSMYKPISIDNKKYIIGVLVEARWTAYKN